MKKKQENKYEIPPQFSRLIPYFDAVEDALDLANMKRITCEIITSAHNYKRSTWAFIKRPDGTIKTIVNLDERSTTMGTSYDTKLPGSHTVSSFLAFVVAYDKTLAKVADEFKEYVRSIEWNKELERKKRDLKEAAKKLGFVLVKTGCKQEEDLDGIR